jgi:hypothetical protein
VGRLQPRLAWDYKIYNARKLGELPPRSQPETPMPPDQVTCLPDAAGILHHGLSVRCVLRKGLTTYWTIPYLRQGQVVARSKNGGYWHKTRSMVISGGLSIPCMIITTNIFHTNRQNHHSSYLIMPYWIYPSQRNISNKHVSTQDRDFPGFLPVGMKGIRGWILSQAYRFQQQGISIMHTGTWS